MAKNTPTCLTCSVPIKAIVRDDSCPVRCNYHALEFRYLQMREEGRRRTLALTQELSEIGIDEFCRLRYTEQDVPIRLLRVLAEVGYRRETVGKGYHRPKGDRPVWTPRRIDIIKLIALGYNDAEIGTKLFIEESTVKTHIKQLFLASGAKNRAHAVHIAHLTGIL